MKIFRFTFDEINQKCSCGQCIELGLVASFSRSEQDFTRSLAKLDQELVTTVLLPCHAPIHPHYAYITEQIEKRGKRILQVVTPETAYDYRDKVDDQQKQKLLVATEDVSDLTYLMTWQVLIKMTKNNRDDFLKLNEIGQHHFVFAPLKRSILDENLSPGSLYRLFKKLKKRNLGLRPFPGLNVYDPRVPCDIEFEPMATIDKKESDSYDDKQGFLLSVIIPVYNQKSYLIKTLEHLTRQKNIDLGKIEVIVIDDGSSDHLSEEIKNVKGLQLKYHYFKRFARREMGDMRFRAGIARNLGFKYSRGKYLLFLDADVLLPSHAFQTILEEVLDDDLVQLIRYDLTSEATDMIHDGSLSLSEVVQEHILNKDRQYWYTFFEKGEQWNQLKHSWKYICTYGLCLSRDKFKELGGFRNNYLGYGFEDTDLGLRLKRLYGTFHLSRIVSYHQYHGRERSEFKESKFKRRRVLSRTAKVFYYNNLDPDIYECLRSYM